MWDLVEGLCEIHDDQICLLVSLIHCTIQVADDIVHKLNQLGFTRPLTSEPMLFILKEAVVEAENMPEVCTPLTSIDIKRAMKDSCTVKWQNRWEASQAGRHMYDLHPSVKAKKKAANSIPTQRITSQLRTGYCYLNGYMHTVGLKDSPLCTCGEPVSVKHYIEDCEQHVDI